MELSFFLFPSSLSQGSRFPQNPSSFFDRTSVPAIHMSRVLCLISYLIKGLRFLGSLSTMTGRRFCSSLLPHSLLHTSRYITPRAAFGVHDDQFGSPRKNFVLPPRCLRPDVPSDSYSRQELGLDEIENQVKRRGTHLSTVKT